MKKIYTTPDLRVEIFCEENIMTASSDILAVNEANKKITEKIAEKSAEVSVLLTF